MEGAQDPSQRNRAHKKYIAENGIDRSLLSKRVGQMYADMIFHHGFVHCDPHPGNVLVRKNKHGNDEVVLLDHGLYTVKHWFFLGK